MLVTGSTDGVGRYVAAELAYAGARVLIHGRDRERAKSLADEIKRAGRGGLREAQANPQAYDEAARKRLRALSLELTGLSVA